MYRHYINGKCLRKRFLGLGCKEYEQLERLEKIPFSDEVAIKKFLDAGFVLSRRDLM